MPTYVETGCTITHEGRTFEAGGAVVTPDYVIAYLSLDGTRYHITDWHGQHLANARITATWRTPHSWLSDTMHQVEATIDGITYTGRSGGAGLIWRGRPKRSK